jgi:hypothetical protein
MPKTQAIPVCALDGRCMRFKHFYPLLAFLIPTADRIRRGHPEEPYRRSERTHNRIWERLGGCGYRLLARNSGCAAQGGETA